MPLTSDTKQDVAGFADVQAAADAGAATFSTQELLERHGAADRLAPRSWRGSIGAMQAIAEAARLSCLPLDAVGSDAAELAHLFDLPAHAIHADAAQAAEVAQRLCDGWEQAGASAQQVLAGLALLAERRHVSLPHVGPKSQPLDETAHKLANRLCSPLWWRRALRKRFRLVEEAAIAAGQVKRGAYPYASARALARAQQDRQRVTELLACMEAVNTRTGEVIRLEEVIQASLANPSNRRKAMAVRIKGVEQHAQAQGMDGLFITLTCPSRMHASSDKYAATTPRQAHAYLCRVWANALRKLKHAGVCPFGLRVVEPHHDACPHWHVLAFVRPEDVDSFTQTLKTYALKDSLDEAGAQEHRFTVERIDRAKGSALAYVMKYVSKSIDGEGVGEDSETAQPSGEAARAIVTWARTHGIRQFQFFGLPPVTPQRELYRVAPGELPDSRSVREAHAFIQANEQGALLALLAMDGLELTSDYTQRPSARYPGEAVRCLVGVFAGGGDLPAPQHISTRSPGEWVIQLRPSERSEGLCAPWTRINNSASAPETGEVPADDSSRLELPEEVARGVKASKPPPRACHIQPLETRF
jgi:hypothetical protein